jgi:hypothetical protein
MEMLIEVEVRDVYGQPKYYPVCDKAKLFTEIAGMKTLPIDILKKIEMLGYRVAVSRTVTF